jgi:hypothetical protein
MKINRKRSEELQQTIMSSPALMRELSEKVAELLGDHIALAEGTSYVFVPRVYTRPVFWPEVYTAASVVERIPYGVAGPLDPLIAKRLNKMRFSYKAVTDPTPEPAGPTPQPSAALLRKAIMNKPELFMQLSESIAEVLTQHGVTFAKDETFAFIPVVVNRPLFNGQLAATTPIPVPPTKPAHLVALGNAMVEIEDDGFDFGTIPGVIINGIPAPEILLALEKQRIAYT